MSASNSPGGSQTRFGWPSTGGTIHRPPSRFIGMFPATVMRLPFGGASESKALHVVYPDKPPADALGVLAVSSVPVAHPRVQRHARWPVVKALVQTLVHAGLKPHERDALSAAQMPHHPNQLWGVKLRACLLGGLAVVQHEHLVGDHDHSTRAELGDQPVNEGDLVELLGPQRFPATPVRHAHMDVTRITGPQKSSPPRGSLE